MVESILQRIVHTAMTNRALLSLLIGAISLAALTIVPRAIIASSLEAIFFGPDHAEYKSYKERTAQFGSDEVFMFGLEVDDPLSPETLEMLDEFHRLAEAIPEVRRVQSIANLSRVGLVGETIGVRRYAELARGDPDSIPTLVEELRADPIAGGLFVSKEFPDVMVFVENVPDPTRPAEAGPGYVALLRGHLVSAGFADEKIHAGGLMAVLSAMMAVSRETLTIMFPLVTCCLLLAVFLMFGRLWPVVVTTLSAAVAVLWTSAFSISQEPVVNILMSILPTFVMIISFSDVVHICSAYLLNLQGGSDKETAIADATVEVGAACFLTSITTAVGFYALTFVPAPAFQTLGFAAAVGVLIAYALAMLIVPICLSTLPTPSDWHAGRVGWVQSAIDKLLDALCILTTERPWAVIAGWAVVLAVLGYGAAQVTFETDFQKRLDEDSPARVDARYIEERFVESTLIDVYVDTPRPGDVIEANTFANMVAFEQEVESWPEVEKVVSYIDLMRATHRSIIGDGAEFGPFSDEELAQMMVLLEMEGPDAMSEFLDFERQSTRMTVYSNVEGVIGQHGIQDRIEARGESIGPGVKVEATGVGPLLGGWLDEILAGQRRGVLFSLLTIMLLLIIGFRSLRAGVVSMVPNVMPLLAAGAWCGFFWDQVDSDTLIVAMIALGIGVDDTIHFISRFQTEVKRRDRLDAIRETFRYSGRGIFITTFVFIVGFLPALTSDYSSIWALGLLLPVCFVVALLADVLLVPALCAVGWIR